MADHPAVEDDASPQALTLRGVRSANGGALRSDEHVPGQGDDVHLATPGRLASSNRSGRSPVERRHHTLDRLAEGGSRRLGSVYYRASCPACGHPAVWHDEAVGQLPGLAVVRTTSEVVCCTVCDGDGP